MMAGPYVIDAAIEHIAHVGSNMRQADKDEIWASSKSRPHIALRNSLSLSRYAKTVMLDGKPIAMFGVASAGALSGRGVPWLLGTADIEKMPVSFLRGCLRLLPEMLKSHTILENWVDVRNKVSVTWLLWLGFTLEKPAPYGRLSLPFHRFYMENPNV